MEVRHVLAENEIFNEECVYVDNGKKEVLFYGDKIETVKNK